MAQQSLFWVCYPKEMESLPRREARTDMFAAVLFTTAKVWEQLKCLTAHERIKRTWCIHNGIFISLKKERHPYMWNR